MTDRHPLISRILFSGACFTLRRANLNCPSVMSARGANTSQLSTCLHMFSSTCEILKGG